VRAQVTAAAALLLAGCGSQTVVSSTPWAPGHPDPTGVHFAAAGGLCTITVQYPSDAPGEIDYSGSAYIQRGRGSTPAQPGTKVATSGDWTLYQRDSHTLVLVTASFAYTYNDGANCGSNSAAPT